MGLFSWLFDRGLVLEVKALNFVDIAQSNHDKLSFSSNGTYIRVKESITIGRQGDLRLTTLPNVSREHCKLIREPNGWKIVDTSKNGMWIRRNNVLIPLGNAEKPHNQTVDNPRELLVTSGMHIQIASPTRPDFIVQ